MKIDEGFMCLEIDGRIIAVARKESTAGGSQPLA
jgi:hypothetical protein